jgi:hypothetical protein
MDEIKIKKTYILVAVYIALIVIELFFYVPYHKIQIFVSDQNVPHTAITGSGYSTIFDIADSDVYVYRKASGKRVDTSQIFINVSTTTIVAAAIYFLLRKNRRIKEMPLLDINALAFADEEASHPQYGRSGA